MGAHTARMFATNAVKCDLSIFSHSHSPLLLLLLLLLHAQKKIETAGFEDESANIAGAIDAMSLAEELRPIPGGPFSALTPSMWPQAILVKLGQPEVSECTDKTHCD